MNDQQTAEKQYTTADRMQLILDLREVNLKAQARVDNLSTKLAPHRAELNLKIAALEKEYETAHATDLKDIEVHTEQLAFTEASIRELVVKEYETRDLLAKKDKMVAPNLGVQVRENRYITDDWTHDAVLAEVKEKYPTLITFDEKKLLKQSKVYDVAYYDENGPAAKQGHPYIKEMPYIEIEQKVSAVIKTGFWEEGIEEMANESTA